MRKERIRFLSNGARGVGDARRDRSELAANEPTFKIFRRKLNTP
jgi:hypothetical protein